MPILNSVSAVIVTTVILTQITTTPLPPVDLAGATGLAQGQSDAGFPQLGSPDAPVHVVEYCAFDASTCDDALLEALAGSLAAGETRYTRVPLVAEGEIANGRGAARAALCAGEQGVYWRIAPMLYSLRAALGAVAFDGVQLVASVDALGIDRAAWDACMSSDRPDRVLAAAQAEIEQQLAYMGTLPFVVVNDVPTLPDPVSVLESVALEAQAAAAATPAPDATDEPVVVTLEPLLGEQITPPFELTLPPDWRYGFDTLVLSDADGSVRTIPLAIYTGPVSGGTGTIVLLWGFPNLVGANPFEGETQPDLWSDGLRLLRLAIIEQGCNIGTDLRREYAVGGATGAGTQFSAVDCPLLPDTRGWFVGVRESGINFVFFVYTDPIDAMYTAEDGLQAILDSVRFNVMVEATATPQP